MMHPSVDVDRVSYMIARQLLCKTAGLGDLASNAGKAVLPDFAVEAGRALKRGWNSDNMKQWRHVYNPFSDGKDIATQDRYGNLGSTEDYKKSFGGKSAKQVGKELDAGRREQANISQIAPQMTGDKAQDAANAAATVNNQITGNGKAGLFAQVANVYDRQADINTVKNNSWLRNNVVTKPMDSADKPSLPTATGNMFTGAAKDFANLYYKAHTTNPLNHIENLKQRHMQYETAKGLYNNKEYTDITGTATKKAFSGITDWMASNPGKTALLGLGGLGLGLGAYSLFRGNSQQPQQQPPAEQQVAYNNWAQDKNWRLRS